MKTLRTIATLLLAAFLVLGPMAAFAAGETVTVTTNAKTYTGQATIQVSGTVTPPPTSAGTSVVITTTGPMGAVDTNEAAVAATTGTYSYVLVAGSSLWAPGTYTVNATYGGPGGTGFGITTFSYTGAMAGVSTTTVTSTTTTTIIVTSATVSVVTVTNSVPSPDAAALTQIQSTLTSITGTLSTISGAITSLTGAVSTLQTAVTGISSQLTTVSTGIQSVGGISAQLTTLNNSINNNQTYVLVVAALAAITLVLELAILVRKLS
jgi:hypothetical protein